MKIQRTRWKPDTCGCIVEYTWDSDLPEDKRVHTVHSVNTCKEHKLLTDPAEAFEVIKKKNLDKVKITDSDISVQ